MKNFRQLIKELPSKKVVMAFGRFQPPTTGHELLVNAVKKIAQKQKADYVIFASRTQDKKTNPLPVDRKVYYLKRMFPKTNFVAANEEVRTFIEAAAMLSKKYKHLVMLAGSDRVAQYETLLNRYNGQEYNFDTIEVVSAGERDPDADNATGMSGTKMREAAKKGDFASFRKGLPHTLTELDGKRLMNEIRQNMGLEAIKEQVKFETSEIREQYVAGQIFNVGDIVESAGVVYQIKKRGSNHLLLQAESGDLVSKWLQDVEQTERDFKLQEGLLDEMKFTPADKIKVARVIASSLGVEDVEKSSNPEQLVNMALRKVRSKPMRPEYVDVLHKMLQTAKEAEIKYDEKLVPQKVSEDTIEESSVTVWSHPTKNVEARWNSQGHKWTVHHNDTVTKHSSEASAIAAAKRKAKSIQEDLDEGSVDKDHPIVKEYNALKKHDIKTLRGMIKQQHRIIDTSEFRSKDHAISHYLRSKHGNKKVDQAFGFHEELEEIKNLIEAIANAKLLGKDTKGLEDKLSTVRGVVAASPSKTPDPQVNNDSDVSAEEEPEAPQGSEIGSTMTHPGESPAARKMKIRYVQESESTTEDDEEDVGQDSESSKLTKMGGIKEDEENKEEAQEEKTLDNLSDKDLDKMADSVDELDDIIDAYEDDELAIIDDETGEKIQEIKEENEMINEVLSRMERMKAKARFAKTAAKRERKLKIALKSRSSNETINSRARKLAVKLMKQRIARKPLNQLSVGEKERIEKMVQKRKVLLNRLAMKLAPRVRKIESLRLSHGTFTKTK